MNARSGPGKSSAEPGAQTLAHWWNGQHGTTTRRDIWVEQVPDGRYQVRWRGGEWSDRDGRFRTATKQAAWGVVQTLMHDEPEDWKRLQ